MPDNSNVTELKRNIQAAPEESPLIVKLSKKYNLDGKEYDKLDLSGMEDLGAADYFKASKVFAMEGFISSKPEADPQFCCMIAAAATGIPKEEFRHLSMRDAARVKDTVFNFFQQED